MQNSKWESPNGIILALVKFKFSTGHFPSGKELDYALREAYPSSRHVKRIFGSLKRAKREAGRVFPVLQHCNQ